jgi:hypothetical protein
VADQCSCQISNRRAELAFFTEACLHTNAQKVSLTDVVVYESTVKENAHVDANDQKQTERKRRIAAD